MANHVDLAGLSDEDKPSWSPRGVQTPEKAPVASIGVQTALR